MILEQIGLGLVGGLAYSLSGLANKDKRENFHFKKMGPTIIVGGIVGAIAGFTGQNYSIVKGSSMAAGITVVIEKSFKAIYRKFIE